MRSQSGLLLASVALDSIPVQDFAARLNLYQRTVELDRQHAYIRLASFLRERLPDHQNITMAFGDAGVFPYAFQSRFIDTNGLAEPFLARLFRLPDGADKTQQYTNYVLSWKPDMLILGVGSLSDNVLNIPVNLHSPFREALLPAVFESYRDYGLLYTCSVKAYYDLHFGVWRKSPNRDAIAAALLDYCRSDGYVLPGGLTVETHGQQIHFPGISPAG